MEFVDARTINIGPFKPTISLFWKSDFSAMIAHWNKEIEKRKGVHDKAIGTRIAKLWFSARSMMRERSCTIAQQRGNMTNSFALLFRSLSHNQ
ncbi:hypothetical protein Y032_0089g2291 [Ancylostoma ceylanicum]|uniref:Uncharacterized protein n=1 Tax=Ancylostoma ceylanicum TaxID=53326 RepID=A0A016TN89_9BILA|nr:hypothetical protein Y032_0089g2291 [Ancylostoma ceylanicum]